MVIKVLRVRNFKSVKDLELSCRRINVFIGEPDTGKSNILEVIGLLSHVRFGLGKIKDFVRMDYMSDIFYNKQTGSEISIEVDNKVLKVRREGNLFRGEFVGEKRGKTQVFLYSSKGESRSAISISTEAREFFELFKFYRFGVREEFPGGFEPFLLPPDGGNLTTLIIGSGELQEVFGDVLSEFGYELVVREFEKKIEVQKRIREGILVSLPLFMVSESVYRLLFHLAAILTNRGSVIAFEEPEIHTHPYYTKYLAERIASDRNNQYFISTHTPYMLVPLIEKTSIRGLAVNVTYVDEGQTKVYTLSDEDLEKLLDLKFDALLNLDRFLRGLR